MRILIIVRITLMPQLTSRAAVGQDAAGAHVLAAAEDLDTRLLVGQVLDANALGEEAAFEHEKQVGGLCHAGRDPGARCCKL